MKTPKFTILESAVISVASFLLQNLILFASFLKFNDAVWGVYKHHGDLYDAILLSTCFLMFVCSWAVWLCADIQLSKRFLIAGLLFAAYFILGLISIIITGFVGLVAVGGY